MVELAVIADRDATCSAIRRSHLEMEVDEVELFGYEAAIDVRQDRNPWNELQRLS